MLHLRSADAAHPAAVIQGGVKMLRKHVRSRDVECTSYIILPLWRFPQGVIHPLTLIGHPSNTDPTGGVKNSHNTDGVHIILS